MLHSLDSSVAVAGVSASSAIVVATITVVIGKHRDARLAVEKATREKKIPVYEELIGFMLRVVMGSKTGDAPSEEEILRFFGSFTQRLMVWGGDEVLKAWVEFRRASVGGHDAPHHSYRLMLRYEEVVTAIRRDLGHRNFGLKPGDVLGLFVNDVDEVLSTLKAN